ncbi:MAG TPA: HPP family protein [bacterium]|nr:HPP family protein [bacterium]
MADEQSRDRPPRVPHMFDPKFNLNTLCHYVSQTALATIFVFFMFLLLHELGQLAIVAALGSSAFIVFAMPDRERSRARYVVGGHVFCLLTGTVLRLLTHGWLFKHTQTSAAVETIIACSLAVGCAIFIMVVTDTEHPPAAGTAVGTAIADFSAEVAVTVVVGAIMLSLGKFLLRRWLKNLV